MRLIRPTASLAIGALLIAAASCSSAAPTPPLIPQTLTPTTSATSSSVPASVRIPTISSPATTSPAITSPATTTPADTPSTSATSPSGTSLHCGAMSSGTHAIEVEGSARTFEAVVPNGLGAAQGRRRAPVIVLFHGFADTAANFLATSGIGALAADHGVIVVAPQATGSPTSWHIGQPEFGDVEFTDAVLAQIRASSCVDTSAIWLAGFSAGSAWVGVYGCSHSDGVAGLLMHSGLPPPICPAATTPNIMIVHGTADPVVPYDGGPQAVGDASVELQSVPASAAGWASTAGCGPVAESRAVGASTITTWSHCAGGRTVSLQSVAGLGHAWSGGTAAPASLNPGCILVLHLTASADPVDGCGGG